MDLNIDKILYDNPEKRFIMAYNSMSSDYTKESAEVFSESYIHESLEFIMNHLRDIVKEPYYGTPFIESMIDNHLSLFPIYGDIYSTTSDFLENRKDAMDKEQVTVYESLLDTIDKKSKSINNTIMMIDYTFESGNDDNQSIKDCINNVYMYNKLKDVDNDKSLDYLYEATEALDNISNPTTFFTLAPYVSKDTDGALPLVSIIHNHIHQTPYFNESAWEEYVDISIVLNTLYKDNIYKEAVNDIINDDVKSIFNGIKNNSAIDKYRTVSTNTVTKEKLPTISSTFENAVDTLFNNDYFIEMTADEFKQNKLMLESSAEIIVDKIGSFLAFESSYDDGVDRSEYISESYNELESLFSEDDLSFFTEAESESKKESFSAPKLDNLLNKIQFKAMDYEAKQNLKRSENKKHGQEIKNTAKAVLSGPQHAIDSVKDTVHQIDTTDDIKRKEKMIEPGYRVRIFAKLKKALLYGSAASVNLALIPVMMVTRHFSKVKDKRIRNEVIRDIQTEIDITNEKINDASADSDKDAKYKLMRVKSKLEQELLRVKTNSKYI